ncbi:MAG: type II secretion system secretin GspD [Lentisphaerae bacterium]|nr:type II secretion system secretin GspD [Lentisphaerota bacterium]
MNTMKPMGRRMAGRAWLVVGLLLALAVSNAQVPVLSPMAAPANATDGELRLKFSNAPIDLVLEAYAEQTGRTLLLAPSLPAANITLRSQGSLSEREYLEAIETVLGMNGIALLPEGAKFIRVVPNKQAREEPMPIRTGEESDPKGDQPGLVSQMITLKYIEAAEAQKAIQPLQHAYAQTHAFEGINSILLTDTAANINRILEVIALIDQPAEAREEPIVVQIHYAKASEIRQKLEQIIADSQKEQKSTVQRQRDSGAPGVVDPAAAAPSTPPGVIRARRTADGANLNTLLEEAERGIIRGQVKMVEDDRTNILIIITRPENMSFFEKIIKVLDVETDPDVLVRVIRLEFAEAKNIASMLNDLIGAASPKDEGGPSGATPPADGQTGGGTALRDYVAPKEPAPAASSTSSSGGGERKSKVGELSKENIKILSDERTNSLIIMASKEDQSTLEEIIKGMDMMLSQVLVEAVILEVNLDDSMQSGVDWVQRTLVAYEQGPNGTLAPKVAYGGGGGGGTTTPIDPTTLTTADSFQGMTGAGLSYYMTLFDLNIDAVFKAVASDSRTHILSSPVILTTDNKEATIEVTQSQYFTKGQRPVQSGSVIDYVDDVERQEVGIKLTVTPRINVKRFVVMELAQTIQNIAGTQRIQDTDWPIVASRKLSADVAVRSGDTIVLGGLVQTTDTKSKSGVPFLADIPILGIPFRSSSKGKKRQEVVVFITPYVLDTPEEIEAEAVRRQDTIGAKDLWQRGWSNSRLAEPRILGQIPDVGSARDTLGYPTNAQPKVKNGGPKPFAASNGSLLGAEPVASPVRTTVESAGPDVTVQRSGGDPLQALDPQTRKYVEEEDRRWNRSLKKVDRKVDKQSQAPAQ